MNSGSTSGRSLSSTRPDDAGVGLPINDGLYSVAALARFPELLHGISTRCAPDGADWNLSSKRGSPQHPPDPSVALANREKLAHRLGIPFAKMVGCQQVHGSEVALVRAEDAGRGMHPEVPPIEGADAMVTNVPGIFMLALSADCPPVFFYDPTNKAIGLAHSGWKGTVARIAANVVEAMSQHYGTKPSDLVVAIGPGIGPCCYSVGPNVIDAVEAAFPNDSSVGAPLAAPLSAPLSAPLLEARDGLTYFNLWEGIRRALLDAGVPPENISVEGVCTAHNLDTFYSHRGEAGQCGLFGAVLGLRDA